MRTRHQNNRIDRRAQISGHVFTEHDGRHGGNSFSDGGQRLCGADTPVREVLLLIFFTFCEIRRCSRIFKLLRRPNFHRIQKIADSPLLRGNHALEHSAPRTRPAGNENLLVDGRGSSDDVRLRAQALLEVSPILDAVTLHAQEIDVGSRPEQAVLQVLAKAVVDSQRNDERSHARSDAQNGNDRDQADNGLAPFGTEVAGGDEEFEAHGLSCSVNHWPAFGVTFGL